MPWRVGFVRLKFDTNKGDYKRQLICDRFAYLFVNSECIFVKTDKQQQRVLPFI